MADDNIKRIPTKDCLRGGIECLRRRLLPTELKRP
jgi:hypothetical protein